MGNALPAGADPAATRRSPGLNGTPAALPLPAPVYSILKLVHVSAVVLSGTGFVLRFGLAAAGRSPASRWARVVPHVVDTVLLASALSLAWVGGFRPLEVPWLEAKLAGLIVYIVAGTMALKRGRTPRVRGLAFAVALVTFAYIVSVALTKNPLGLLAGGPR